MFTSRNNFHNEVRTSITELIHKVRKREVFIYKADKDGKILIIDYSSYYQIMSNQLPSQFTQLDLNVVFYTVGVKHKNGVHQQAKRYYAKFFGLNKTAYAYPLFNPKKLKVFFRSVYSTLVCSSTTNFERLYLE